MAVGHQNHRPLEGALSQARRSVDGGTKTIELSSSENYIYQAYPKCKYTWDGKNVVVKDATEEAALGFGWVDSPGPFMKYGGPRPPKLPEQDETQWVEEWPVAGLLADHRNKIKAKVMVADADFWRSHKADSDVFIAMRRAYTGIAEVLSAAGLLTVDLLRNQIPVLVWDSAIAGGWYRVA
jgi:hypothetical protein